MFERDDARQFRLSFIEVENAGEIWIYAVLVSSLGSEILSVSQLYREIPIIKREAITSRRCCFTVDELPTLDARP
jgi:hypothetical protein